MESNLIRKSMPEVRSKQLTQEQIDYLFDFVYRKRVRYYDVQVEIVDHLASAIEEKWRENPDLSFEQALDQVYNSFGIFGFAKVVEARERAVQKQGVRELGRFFKSLLHPSKLWVPLGLFFGLYQLFLYFPEEQLEKYILITAFLLYLPVFYFSFRYTFQSSKRKSKSFLLLQMPLSMAAGVGGAMYGALYSWINLLINHIPNTHGALLAMAGLFILALLYGYAAAVYLPRRAEEMMRQQFPEYAR